MPRSQSWKVNHARFTATEFLREQAYLIAQTAEQRNTSRSNGQTLFHVSCLGVSELVVLMVSQSASILDMYFKPASKNLKPETGSCSTSLRCF